MSRERRKTIVDTRPGGGLVFFRVGMSNAFVLVPSFVLVMVATLLVDPTAAWKLTTGVQYSDVGSARHLFSSPSVQEEEWTPRLSSDFQVRDWTTTT